MKKVCKIQGNLPVVYECLSALFLLDTVFNEVYSGIESVSGDQTCPDRRHSFHIQALHIVWIVVINVCGCKRQQKVEKTQNLHVPNELFECFSDFLPDTVFDEVYSTSKNVSVGQTCFDWRHTFHIRALHSIWTDAINICASTRRKKVKNEPQNRHVKNEHFE